VTTGEVNVATPDQPRRSWIVGATKVPYEQRDVAHAVLTPEDDRGFYNVIGAADDPTDGHTLPVGAAVTYRVDLTDAEAERFRHASNCRYVELDTENRDGAIPSAATLAFMRADFQTAPNWHGRDVLIGLLDGGTTAAVRSYLSATMVAKQTFGPDAPGADEITSTHGCMVAPCLIPPGGRFLDAVVSDNNGGRLTSASVAAARWCADQGAKILNYSGSGPAANTAWNDMLQYLLDRGVQFFAAMGNDNVNQAYYPAALSTSYTNCHSSISFDTATGKRSTFSNYTFSASGCAPGTNVGGLAPDGTEITVSGTSFSCPHMARLCIMGATGGRFTPAQMGAALKATVRDTGQPDTQQGAGAYSLAAALTSLGAQTGQGADYHPIAQIWPTSQKWPDDGEYDFVSNVAPGEDHWDANLYYPRGANVAEQRLGLTSGSGVDMSQWHNIAIEKSPEGISLFLDGVRKWGPLTGGAITGVRKNIQDMPSGHLALQLDNFTGSSGLIPATMEVDWVKVYSLTPTGGGGGGGGTSTGTLADRWRIGFADGLSKINLGIDFLPGDGADVGKKGQHWDADLSKLTRSGGFTYPGYVDLRDDGAVRLTSYVGAATTPNSTHSRVEQRALAQNGVDKESINTKAGEHYLWGRIAVIRPPTGRKRICLGQWHTPDDDLCMILYDNGNIVSTYGDTGRPGTLATGISLGSIHQLMIKIVWTGSQAEIRYYWDNMLTPGATQGYAGGSGNYRKGPGNYQQSSTQYDQVGEMSVVDVYDMEYWSTGMPEPKSRH
jgi:hypothetical protein